MPAFIFKHTGNIPTAKDSIPKILWLKEERPEIWEQTAYLLDCKEYILFKLTGRIAIDWVGASVYFLFDPRHQDNGREEVCQELGIPIEKLPPAYPLHGCDRRDHPPGRPETGLKAGTPW